MRLAAVYNTWDGEELLPHSIKTLIDHVDIVIIIYQNISNIGELYRPMLDLEMVYDNEKIKFVEYVPTIAWGGTQNEIAKRNLGLYYARQMDCDHFLFVDNDEFYEDFGTAKDMFIASGYRGSVCRLQTYFKTPTLRFDKPEDYFVPFIHRLCFESEAGNQANHYQFYVDPTRKVNESEVIELPIFMHHFSWVRKDIHRKIRNSSAPIQHNKIALRDWENAKEGSYLINWQRTLITVPDQFNLSSLFI